jgi:hypothetical protein
MHQKFSLSLVTVIITATLTLLPISAYGAPEIQWAPSLVSQVVPLGTTRSFQVEFVSSAKLTNVTFRVVPALAPYVRVEPANLATIQPKVAVPVTLHVNFSSATDPIEIDGVLQVVSSDGKKQRIQARPLPIVLFGNRALPGASDVTFFTGTSSPLWLSFKREERDVVILGGTRDVQGLPTKLESVQQRSDTGENGQILLDSRGRPAVANLQDGSKVTFLWTNATRAIVTALTRDGQFQANVGVDFPGLPLLQTGSVLDLTATDKVGKELLQSTVEPRTPRASQSMPLSMAASLSGPIVTQAAPPGTGIIQVGVLNELNYPVSGADLDVTVSYGLGTNLGAQNLPVVEVGGGIYEARFQNLPNAIPDGLIDDACSETADKVSIACGDDNGNEERLLVIAKTMVAGGCAEIGARIFVLTLNPVISADFVIGCEAAFSAVVASCTVAALGPALCPAIDNVVNFFDPGGIDVHASARKGNLSGSGSTTASSTASLIQIGLTLKEPDCQILDFSVSPVDPAAFEGYVASVTLGCAGAPPSQIVISMHGTDGFATATSCSLKSECELSVPGAEEGIVDSISVTTSAGVTRTLSLTFKSGGGGTRRFNLDGTYSGNYSGTAFDTDDDGNPITYNVAGSVEFTVSNNIVNVIVPGLGSGVIEATGTTVFGVATADGAKCTFNGSFFLVGTAASANGNWSCTFDGGSSSGVWNALR